MADAQLYYWVAQLSVLNDWLFGRRDDPATRLEMSELSDSVMMSALYGRKVCSRLPPVTRVEFVFWSKALNWAKWNRDINGERPLWKGNWIKTGQ